MLQRDENTKPSFNAWDEDTLQWESVKHGLKNVKDKPSTGNL